jgi:hypothetical protein
VGPRTGLNEMEKLNSCPLWDSNTDSLVVQPVTSRYQQSAATCSRWFLASGFFYPEDGGDTFLQNVGSHEITWCHIPEEGILHKRERVPLANCQFFCYLRGFESKSFPHYFLCRKGTVGFLVRPQAHIVQSSLLVPLTRQVLLSTGHCNT